MNTSIIIPLGRGSRWGDTELKINRAHTYQELKDMIKNRLWFSIGDAAREGELLHVLKELYPNKSRYESSIPV